MKHCQWLWCLAITLLFSCPAQGQTQLDNLIGTSGDSGSLKTTRLLSVEKAKASLARIEKQIREEKKQQHQETLAAQLKGLQKRLLNYQGYPSQRRYRRDAEILKLRERLVKQLKRWSEALLKRQGAHSSREQSLDALRAALRSYLSARKNFSKQIEAKFPIQKRKQLKQVMDSLRKRLGTTRKKLRTIILHIAKLRKAQQLQRQQLDKVRRKMFSPPPLPAPRRPPAVRPEPRKTKPVQRRTRRRRRRSRRKKSKNTPVEPVLSAAEKARLERKKERELLVERLVGKQQRYLFETLRQGALLLKVRQQDEEIQRQTLQTNAALLQWTLSLMEEIYKSHAAKAEGGLLHHKPFHINAILLDQVYHHTLKLGEKLPGASGHLHTTLLQRLNRLRVKLGWWVFLLGLLLPMLALGVAWFVRRMLQRGLLLLARQTEENPESPLVWRSLRTGVQVLHDLLFWVVLILLLLWSIGSLGLPASWNRIPTVLGWSFLVARTCWTLAEELFSPDLSYRLVFVLNDGVTTRLRRLLRLAGWLSLLSLPILRSVELMGYPRAFLELLSLTFFGVVLGGLWLSAALRPEQEEEKSEDKNGSVVGFLLRWLYPLLLLLGTSIYGMYGWGYRNLSLYVGRALLLSIALIGAAGTSQQLLYLLFRKLVVKPEQPQNPRILKVFRGVLSILLGFVTLSLILSAWKVPGGIKALYNLLNYPILKVQKSQVSLLSLLKFVLVFGSSIWLSGFLKKQFAKHLYPLLSLKSGGQHAANTVLGYLVIILGVLLGLQVMGMSIGVLAVFAGVIGIGVGFGMQNVANNFISGLLITFGRPIAVGDVIEVGGVTGVVQQISARSTTIETLDSRLILIPNSDIIATQVINWSLGPPYVIAMMRVGVAYDSDIDQVYKALLEVAQNHPSVLQHPAPEVRFEDFGQGALEYLLLAAIADPRTKWDILSELRIATNQHFRSLGIEIAWSEDQAGRSGLNHKDES